VEEKMKYFSMLMLGCCAVCSYLHAIPCDSVTLGGDYFLSIDHGDQGNVLFTTCQEKPEIHLNLERDMKRSLPCFAISGAIAETSSFATLFEKEEGFCFLIFEEIDGSISPKQITRLDGLNIGLGTDEIDDLSYYYKWPDAYLTFIPNNSIKPIDNIMPLENESATVSN
jgi:hypothetical protein